MVDCKSKSYLKLDFYFFIPVQIYFPGIQRIFSRYYLSIRFCLCKWGRSSAIAKFCPMESAEYGTASRQILCEIEDVVFGKNWL